MINSTPLPPVPSPVSPAHTVPVVWVPVNSNHLIPLIIPVFLNMPLPKEGLTNVENVRPIQTEEEATEKEIKGEPTSEDPMPEAEPDDSKDASKDKIDLLAKFIAKEVIPEKLANLALAKTHVQHTTTPTQPSKDDKGAVEQAQKDPKNSNLAVPKESVKPSSDQASYNKPHFAATTNASKGMNEDGSLKNLPENNSRVANTIQKNFSETVKIDSSSVKNGLIEGRVNPSTAKNSDNSRIDSKKNNDGVKNLEIEKRPLRDEEAESENSKESQNYDKNRSSKRVDGSLKTNTVEVPAHDPLRKVPTDPSRRNNRASDAVSEIETNKHSVPRKDAIPILDKNESVSVQQMHKFVDESLIARMPIMPDFPLSREAILRQAGTPKNTRLREDQGYRLGDLMVMILSGALAGAKNTVEVCRYLLSKEKFFKVWMGIKNAMPTYRMLWFLLNRLEPKFLEVLLQESLGMRPPKLVHSCVWESHRGFTLGELVPLTPTQAPEILLDVLDLIDIHGAMVNVDAPKLNKTAARKIQSSGGEYILTLKGDVCKQAEAYLDKAHESIDHYRDIIQDGALTSIREIQATDQLTWFEKWEEWPYLKSLVKFKSQSIQGSQVSFETRLYLSSLPKQADRMAQIIRFFSFMEGKVNWLMDFDFLMQESKEFHENESANIDILRRFSEEILFRDTIDTSSIEAKRKKVRESNDYLRYLVNNLNQKV